MVSRRTWARFVFLANLLVFPLRVYQWYRATDEHGRPVSLVPQWLVAGLTYRVAYAWAYDHDLGAIRTKRWRRASFGLSLGTLTQWALPSSGSARHSFSLGESIGRVGYRLWYGVVRPPAGGED